jgi:hypothetical protein
METRQVGLVSQPIRLDLLRLRISKSHFIRIDWKTFKVL